jgi:hypothetical protein
VSDEKNEGGLSLLSSLLNGAETTARKIDLPPRLKALAVERSPEDPNAGRVALVALTDEQIQEAHFEAFEHLRKKKNAPPEWYWETEDGRAQKHNELQVQVLHRALRHPTVTLRHFATSVGQLRGALFPDEREYLMQEYLRFAIDRRPYETLTPAALDKLVDDAGKGCLEATSLSCYDAASLCSITLELASQLSALQSRLSLVTTLQNDSTPDSSLHNS